MSESPEVQQILDEFGRLQERNARQVPQGPPRRVLGLLLGDEFYGLDISGIRGIDKVKPVTFVPGAPATLVGVINQRGQMLPIVDLRLLVGLDPWRGLVSDSSPVNRARVVVVAHGEVLAGLLVDGVTEVHEIREPLEPPVPAHAEIALVEGQAMIGGRLMLLLNLPNLIARLTG